MPDARSPAANSSSGWRKPRSEPDELSPSLVIRLREGDAGAGQMLDRLYRQPMMRFCLGYLRNPADAEDAVQEIFCSALKARAIPDSFKPWLYKIARNHCLQVLRSRQRRPDPGALPSDSLTAPPITAYLSRLIKVETVGRIGELLATLSPQQRELLQLRYAENLSRKEIAELLDEPEALIKSRLFEAVDKLRRLASG